MEKLFKSIGEVSKELDVASHILRFWEENFKNISPVRRSGGRRYYHIKDVELLHKIKDLLYKKGYTLKGARKILSQKNVLDTIKNTEEKTTANSNNSNLNSLLSSILIDLKSLKREML